MHFYETLVSHAPKGLIDWLNGSDRALNRNAHKVQGVVEMGLWDLIERLSVDADPEVRKRALRLNSMQVRSLPLDELFRYAKSVCEFKEEHAEFMAKFGTHLLDEKAPVPPSPAPVLPPNIPEQLIERTIAALVKMRCPEADKANILTAMKTTTEDFGFKLVSIWSNPNFGLEIRRMKNPGADEWIAYLTVLKNGRVTDRQQLASAAIKRQIHAKSDDPSPGDVKKRNPAIPRTLYKAGGRTRTHSAYVADRKAHYQAPEMQRAQAAVQEVLAGRGTLLGNGNFGVAYSVVVDGLPLLVKMGTQETIHSRSNKRLLAKYPLDENLARHARTSRRSKDSMREVLIHEAGVANTLWAAGSRIIPETVYLEHKNIPALVRELGEIVDAKRLPLSEVDALADGLLQVLDLGWEPADDLLIARRTIARPGAPVGSLFVADVGVWHQWIPGTGLWDTLEAKQKDVFRLLDRAVDAPSRAEMVYTQNKIAKLRADLASGDRPEFLTKINLNNAIKTLAQIEAARSARVTGS
jgi:hypothetical protein